MRARTIIPFGLIGAACGSFTAAPDPDAPVDAATPKDAGAESAASTKDAGDRGECVDFLTTTGSFTFDANTSYEAGVGFTLVLGGDLPYNPKRSIFRTYSITENIRQSIVDIDMKVRVEGSTENTYYINAVGQYLGPQPAFNSAFPLNGLQQVRGGTKLDFWPNGGQDPTPAQEPLNVPFANTDGHVILDTVWSKEGSVVVKVGATGKAAVERATTSGATSRSLTVEIGGYAEDTAPQATYVVRGICVKLLP